MAAPEKDYRFVNAPAAHRSARIPELKWEEHRAEVTEIYLASNLSEVVAQMQLRHNFQATKRQYVHQFQKWGIRKLGEVATADEQPYSITIATPNLGTLTQPAPKRRRTAASVDSASTCSVDSTSTKPPKKKHDCRTSAPQSDQELYPTDASHGGLEWEAPPDISLDRDECGSEEVGSPATNACGNDEMLGSKISAVSLISNAEASGTQRSATPTNAAASPQRPSPPAPPGTRLSRPQTTDTPAGRHNMKTTGDEPPVVEFTTTIDEKSSHGDHRRTIDRNRPVDTFSDQDMVAIKRAADCFAVMGCDKEAFELYITMLKRRIPRAERFKDANFWHLVIQCAYTASNAEHAEVIRNIIQAELGHPHYWPSMRTAFLMHMLLAFICNRIDDYKGVGIHLKKARANGPPFDDFIKWVFLFSDVSHHDRSLYLAVLRNLERFESEELVLGSVDPSLTTVGPRTPKRRGFLEDYILSELPQVVKFNSSCVSSCLVWCHRRLKELASKRPSTAGPWVSHPELPKPMYDLKDDLFIMLWRQWGSSSVTDAPRWIRESQGEVGISPTEMLMVVCRMIVALHFSNNPEDQVNESEADLVRRLSDACKFMLKEPKLERRKRFLAEYVWLNSVTPWLDMRPGAQRMDRLLVVEYVEETLMVRFPDIGGPTEDLQTTLSAFPSVPLRGDRSQASATGKQLSPTLASSLSSLDLTIFKKVGAKASRLRDLLLRTSSAPSSVSLGVSSDLSDSLNAMSISGGN